MKQFLLIGFVLFVGSGTVVGEICQTQYQPYWSQNQGEIVYMPRREYRLQYRPHMVPHYRYAPYWRRHYYRPRLGFGFHWRYVPEHYLVPAPQYQYQQPYQQQPQYQQQPANPYYQQPQRQQSRQADPGSDDDFSPFVEDES